MEMALDDIITRKGRGRGRRNAPTARKPAFNTVRRNTVGVRRGNGRVAPASVRRSSAPAGRRSAPVAQKAFVQKSAGNVDGKWTHDLFNAVQRKSNVAPSRQQAPSGRRQPANTGRQPRQPKSSIDGRWGHDLFQEQPLATSRPQRQQSQRREEPAPLNNYSDIQTPTRTFSNQPAQAFQSRAARGLSLGRMIYVSNLGPEVVCEDMEELFQRYGSVQSATILYGPGGMSLGRAEVVFADANDAYKAVKGLQGVTLDGLAIQMTQMPDSAIAPALKPKRETQNPLIGLRITSTSEPRGRGNTRQMR